MKDSVKNILSQFARAITDESPKAIKLFKEVQELKRLRNADDKKNNHSTKEIKNHPNYNNLFKTIQSYDKEKIDLTRLNLAYDSIKVIENTLKEAKEKKITTGPAFSIFSKNGSGIRSLIKNETVKLVKILNDLERSPRTQGMINAALHELSFVENFKDIFSGNGHKRVEKSIFFVKNTLNKIVETENSLNEKIKNRITKEYGETIGNEELNSILNEEFPRLNKGVNFHNTKQSVNQNFSDNLENYFNSNELQEALNLEKEKEDNPYIFEEEENYSGIKNEEKVPQEEEIPKTKFSYLTPFGFKVKNEAIKIGNAIKDETTDLVKAATRLSTRFGVNQDTAKKTISYIDKISPEKLPSDAIERKAVRFLTNIAPFASGGGAIIPMLIKNGGFRLLSNLLDQGRQKEFDEIDVGRLAKDTTKDVAVTAATLGVVKGGKTLIKKGLSKIKQRNLPQKKLSKEEKNAFDFYNKNSNIDPKELEKYKKTFSDTPEVIMPDLENTKMSNQLAKRLPIKETEKKVINDKLKKEIEKEYFYKNPKDLIEDHHSKFVTAKNNKNALYEKVYSDRSLFDKNLKNVTKEVKNKIKNILADKEVPKEIKNIIRKNAEITKAFKQNGDKIVKFDEVDISPKNFTTMIIDLDNLSKSNHPKADFFKGQIEQIKKSILPMDKLAEADRFNAVSYSPLKNNKQLQNLRKYKNFKDENPSFENTSFKKLIKDGDFIENKNLWNTFSSEEKKDFLSRSITEGMPQDASYPIIEILKKPLNLPPFVKKDPAVKDVIEKIKILKNVAHNIDLRDTDSIKNPFIKRITLEVLKFINIKGKLSPYKMSKNLKYHLDANKSKRIKEQLNFDNVENYINHISKPTNQRIQNAPRLKNNKNLNFYGSSGGANTFNPEEENY